ncbi:hypothetical protein D9611_005592 [Ephemerocybe angulata]|uniref:BRCA2 OB1 domain-containing protein n=1 Tax=Ephemerocybe angulata TaxID=980116 RepID=A0A8H5BJN2_9AGAR|nr:hypothetical protein D9611_005592 [Tulosesus angulatus]
MLQHARSPSSSPIRKRQRLSSPTYDEQVGDLSQDYLEAFDQIEFSLSQAPHNPERSLQSKSTQGPSADPESPFFVNPAHIPAPSATTSKADYSASFKLASALRKSSPETENAPSNDWLKTSTPSTRHPLPLFRSAKVVDEAIISKDTPPSPDKENVGILRPSAAALAAARAKALLWEAEMEDDLDPPNDVEDPSAIVIPSSTKLLTPLRSVNPMPPPTSTPLQPLSRNGFKAAGMGSQPRPFRPPAFKAPSSVLASSSRIPIYTNSQPTSRIPLLTQSNSRIPVPTNSQQTPQTPRPGGFRTPARTNQPMLKQTPKLPSSTPGRSIGLSRKNPSTFASPFKSPLVSTQGGARPQPVSLLRTQLQNRVYPPAGRPTPSPSIRQSSLKPTLPPSRMQSLLPVEPPAASTARTLESSGLRPQRHSKEELVKLGLNVQELSQVKLPTALHYCFYSFDSATPITTEEGDPLLLNAAAAYHELIKQGCKLATESWVNNHWCLILWKLAGMAALDPTSEQSVDTKRWCWKEVMRQLRKRYDVELNGAKRPILRKVVCTDSPSTLPMVLCVSAILEGEGGHPMLEVTDGWYRIKAQIDAPLARAIQKGAIREGRKLVVSGARLNSEKKDPQEILEAYDSVTLRISGNSSSLAPWHMKLGALHERYISTLHSLTHDGGSISCLDVVITKIHPLAFMEFVEENGKTTYVGPRNEAEESKEADMWEKRREKEASKLREVHEKRMSLYMDYLARLEAKAEKSRALTDDDSMPNYIDSYYDDLEEHGPALKRIASISSLDARWLAEMVRQNLEGEHERISAEIEKELADICPRRNVRNFQVLVVKDARTDKRTSHRVANLTVWDANKMDMSEGSTSGTFAVGQRFLVSNLNPTHTNSWMGNEPGAEIFMSTRKDSQWVKRRI